MSEQSLILSMSLRYHELRIRFERSKGRMVLVNWIQIWYGVMQNFIKYMHIFHKPYMPSVCRVSVGKENPSYSANSNCYFITSKECGVRGREVERRPRTLEVPSSIPGSGCQLRDFFIGPHIRREYWCSSQEAESRKISISCKNLFLTRCKINMFKLFITKE